MYRACDAVTHAYWTEEARKSAQEAVAMSQASRAEFAELLQKLEGQLGQVTFSAARSASRI